jgi:hypothetical protein
MVGLDGRVIWVGCMDGDASRLGVPLRKRLSLFR